MRFKPTSRIITLFGLASALHVLAQAPLPPPPPPPPVSSQALPPAPPAPPSPSAPTGVSPATSAASIPEGLTPANRDPFWPVGFIPTGPRITTNFLAVAAPVETVSAPKWEDARASLRIGGYMKGPGGFTALVNNTPVSTGDVVSLVFEDKHYRWKIESISTRGITFIPIDWMPLDSQTHQKDRP